MQRIVPLSAGQGVVAGAAGDDIGPGIAAACEVAGAGEGQVLDVRAEGEVVARCLDRIGAFVRELDEGVIGVDHIEVVAQTALEGVGDARPADQDVVPAQTQQSVAAEAAVEGIGQAVADQGVDEGRTDQVLDAVEGVGPAVAVVAGGADIQPGRHPRRRRAVVRGVGAQAAAQDVVSAAAAQDIVPRAAVQQIGEAVAGQAVGEGRADQVLDLAEDIRSAVAVVGRGPVGQAGRHPAGGGGVVGGVVPAVALQPVDPAPAAQHVVARAALDRVVRRIARAAEGRGPGVEQVLEMGLQHIGGACGLDGVRALAAELGHRVIGVDHIDVVAQTALEGVGGARPADQDVVPAQTQQDVSAQAAGQDVGAAGADQTIVEGRAGQVLDVEEGVATAVAVRGADVVVQLGQHAGGGAAVVDGVIADAAVQGVVAGGPDQDVAVRILAVDGDGHGEGPAPRQGIGEAVGQGPVRRPRGRAGRGVEEAVRIVVERPVRAQRQQGSGSQGDRVADTGADAVHGADGQGAVGIGVHARAVVGEDVAAVGGALARRDRVVLTDRRVVHRRDGEVEGLARHGHRAVRHREAEAGAGGLAAVVDVGDQAVVDVGLGKGAVQRQRDAVAIQGAVRRRRGDRIDDRAVGLFRVVEVEHRRGDRAAGAFGHGQGGI